MYQKEIVSSRPYQALDLNRGVAQRGNGKQTLSVSCSMRENAKTFYCSLLFCVEEGEMV